MKKETTLSREEQRMNAENYLCCLIGHLFSSVWGAFALYACLKFLPLTNPIYFITFLIVIALYDYYVLNPLFSLVGKKTTPPSENGYVNYFMGMFAFAPIMKRDFLYLRWVITGEDHPILNKNSTQKS